MYMSHRGPALPLIFRSSYGTHLLGHRLLGLGDAPRLLEELLLLIIVLSFFLLGSASLPEGCDSLTWEHFVPAVAG